MRYIIVSLVDGLTGDSAFVLIVDTTTNTAIARCATAAVAGPIRDALNATEE